MKIKKYIFKKIIFSIFMSFIIMGIMLDYNYIMKSDILTLETIVESIDKFEEIKGYNCQITNGQYEQTGEDPQLYLSCLNDYNRIEVSYSCKYEKNNKKNSKEEIIRWQLYYGMDNEAFCEEKSAVVCTDYSDNKVVIDINENARDSCRLDIDNSESNKMYIKQIKFIHRQTNIRYVVFLIIGLVIISYLLLEIICRIITKFGWKPDNLNLYCLVSILSFFFTLGIIMISHGELFSHYFFYDVRDSGMDFFHSIEYVKGRDPYGKFNTLYPPLANLIFGIFYRFIPSEVSYYWKNDFKESVLSRGTDIDLRTYQAPFVLFIIVFIVSAIVIFELVEYFFRNEKCIKRKLMALSVVLSYGMLLSFERGNIIIWAWIFLFIFLLTFESENKFIREMGYISLAVSAGLKLYPAVFGILIIGQKRYKEALRTVFYGGLGVILPSLIFKNGILSLLDWVKVVINFSEAKSSGIGNGFDNIIYSFSSIIGCFANGWSINENVSHIAKIIVILALLLSTFILKKNWEKFLALTLAMDLYSSQGDYIFIFFIIVLLWMIKDESVKAAGIEIICISLLTINLPMFYVQNNFYPRTILNQILVVILTFLIFRKTIRQLYEIFFCRRINE